MQCHNPRENVPLLKFLLDLRISWCLPSLLGPQPPLWFPPGELSSRLGFEAGSGCWAQATTQHCLSKTDSNLDQSVLQRPWPSQHGSSKGALLGIWPKQSQSCWWGSKNCDGFCQQPPLSTARGWGWPRSVKPHPGTSWCPELLAQHLEPELK